jgi:transposase
VKVKTLGIDLAKETFGLHGVDALGRVVVHKRVTRKQLRGFLVKLEPCLVGMEACGSAHYWARAADLTSLKAAFDLAKTFVGVHDQAVVRAKVIELQGQILAAQS